LKTEHDHQVFKYDTASSDVRDEFGILSTSGNSMTIVGDTESGVPLG
jgi:hypothetical protein